MTDLEGMINQDWVCKFLTDWILTANVDKYERPDKTVFIASKDNDFLVLTCDRQPFYNVRIIWNSDDKTTIVHRGVISENGLGITHTTGLMWGERVESIYGALISAERNAQRNL